MPKTKLKESVLHEWVHGLTFQMQALLLTAMRGPDTLPKHNDGKAIVRYLRGAVIKPAGNWYGENDNDFMWGEMEVFGTWADNFWRDHDQYPHHFIMHLLHCSEVIGYKHPIEIIRRNWLYFYHEGCKSFHLQTESEKEMDERLNDFGEGIHN